MASEAEVDLIISTAGALPELERDLQRIITQAEGSASTLDVDAALDVGASLANLAEEIETVVQRAEAGASDIDLEAALDAGRTLAEVQSQLERITRQASQGEPIDLEAALNLPRSIGQVGAQVRALVEEVEATAPDIEIEVDVDQDGRGAAGAVNLGKAFKGLIPSLGRVQKIILAVGAASVASLPALAGVAAAVEQIAPAAALAAPSLLTVALAAGTVKLAMNGMEDAIKAAFDPETSPEELAEALKGLAPEARAFVLELQKMKTGLKDVQQAVQQNFFKGFDDALKLLGDRTLPIFSRALQNTSNVLNGMAHGVAGAALELGDNGTLGKALNSANRGLLNLVKVPGQVTTAFGQLAAAAGPSFERLTKAAADAATSISERLSASFESDGLEDAIDNALDALAQFGRSVGNIFEGLGNIFSTVSQQGGGLFATLEKITQAFADVTATRGFQDALKALTETAGNLVSTVLPLISKALQTLGPVFQALGPPLDLLIKALGEALGPIIEALGPPLVSLALLFGRLVQIVNPFLKLISDIAVGVMPGLTAQFDALGQIFNAIVPFAKALADTIGKAVLPIFERWNTEVLPQILPKITELATKLFPLMTETLIKLSPSLIRLGEAFAEMAVALAPLIIQLTELSIQFLEKLLPVIEPILAGIIKLIELGLDALTFSIGQVLIPAIGVLVDLLQGDFRGAWEGIKDIVANVTQKIQDQIKAMKDFIVDQLRQLAERIGAKVLEIRDKLVQGFNDMVAKTREVVAMLPQVFIQGLAGAGQFLVQAGKDIVQGLINGLTSQLGRLREIARQIGDTVSSSVKDFLGIHSPSRVMMEVGNNTMEGFLQGLQDRIPDLRKELQGVAALAPSFALPNGQVLSLPQASADAPVVQVFLGNELLNGHVDARISQSNQSRDRLAIQGTRR